MRLVLVVLTIAMLIGCTLSDVAEHSDSMASPPALSTQVVAESYGLACGPMPNGWSGSTVACKDVRVTNASARHYAHVTLRGLSVSPSTQHGALLSDSTVWALPIYTGSWYVTPDGAPDIGVMLPGTSQTIRVWYSDPDRVPIAATYGVVAADAYSYRGTDWSGIGYVDACVSGASLGKQASAAVSFPFEFTHYHGTYTAATIDKRGAIRFGAAALPFGGPAVLAYFDEGIEYGPAGEVCTAVDASGPGRKWVATWRHMAFADDPGADVSFSLVLSEGTDGIDVGFGPMSCSDPSRCDGSSAYFGPVADDGYFAGGGGDGYPWLEESSGYAFPAQP